MLKKNKGTLILTSILTILPILAGLILWNKLPDQIATHWSASGEANGWSSKSFAVFGLPAFLLLMHWVCVFATLSDPRRRNISYKLFRVVIWLIPILSLLCNGAVYAAALGANVRFDMIVMPLLGVLFIVIGNYLPKCKQSYTMGIKLPWTLHDEENWNRTHRLAGKVWVIGGAAILLTIPFQANMLLPFIVAIMVLIPTVYSYVYYRKHRN